MTVIDTVILTMLTTFNNRYIRRLNYFSSDMDNKWYGLYYNNLHVERI